MELWERNFRYKMGSSVMLTDAGLKVYGEKYRGIPMEVAIVTKYEEWPYRVEWSEETRKKHNLQGWGIQYCAEEHLQPR